jgi:Glycosyltransferase
VRILQIHNYYKYYGGEDRVADTEKVLLENNGDVVIPFYVYNKSIDQFNFWDKIAFFLNTINNRQLLKRLIEAIDKTKPDVAHIHNIFPLISSGVYAVLAKKKVPIVQSIHDQRLALLCPQGNGYRNSRICKLCFKGNFLHCITGRCVKDSLLVSALYALSLFLNRMQNVAKRYVTKTIYFDERMHKLLLSIGFTKDSLMKKPHFLYENNQPSYAYEKYFLFLGGTNRHKGILTLVEAFKKIDTDFKLKIIGAGDCLEEMKLSIQDHPNIEYLGYIPGIERFTIMKNAYCTISPSEFFETFGMTVLESLSFAVPVIASDVGAFPALVIHGKTGLLFPPGNVSELQNSIEKLIHDPELCKRLGKNGYDHYLANYTKEKNYQMLNNIYKAAIAENIAK